MEYVKHKYSKRVYRVMTDHGPEHPYLSCFPYVRNIYRGMLEKFFSPCGKPQVEYESTISVSKEIEWEKCQLRREEPIVVKSPRVISKSRTSSKRTPQVKQGPVGYTLKDLCSGLGISPATARRVLRSKGMTAPEGGWRWSNPEAAKDIKEILKKF